MIIWRPIILTWSLRDRQTDRQAKWGEKGKLTADSLSFPSFQMEFLIATMKTVFAETLILQMVLEPSIWLGNRNSIFTWSPVFISVATEHVLVDSDYCHCWPFGVTEGMECARKEVLLWSPVAHLPFFPRNLNRSKESHQSFVIFWIDAEDHWLHVYRWMLRGKKRQFPLNMTKTCQI